jgi:hypothetical protein
MGIFSRSNKTSDSCVPCERARAAKNLYEERKRLVAAAREKLQRERESGKSSQELAAVGAAIDRFDRDTEAMIRAEAAENVYDQSKAVDGLTNLSQDLAKLNAQLGLPENNGLTARDFNDPESGFRAALYKSEANGRYILAFAGTDPNALSDWETNIDNGLGLETEQYKMARELAAKLTAAGVDFDITGHSKGGGMATDAGLVAPQAKIWTFNSAGLNPNAPSIAGAPDFGDLESRTQAFHNQGDFLTLLQTEKDPEKQIANAEMLRKRLSGGEWGPSPLKITKMNPDDTNREQLDERRNAFMNRLDGLIADAKQKQQRKEPFDLFPAAIGQSQEVGKYDTTVDTIWALMRHTMPGVGLTKGVRKDIQDEQKQDEKSLKSFVQVKK